MVEENAVCKVHAIRLAIVHHGPVREQLGHCVWAARVERGVLGLCLSLLATEELGRAGLVEARLLFKPASSDGVEQAKHADSVRLGGVIRHLKGHFHVRLCPKVVHLVGSHLGHDLA